MCVYMHTHPVRASSLFCLEPSIQMHHHTPLVSYHVLLLLLSRNRLPWQFWRVEGSLSSCFLPKPLKSCLHISASFLLSASMGSKLPLLAPPLPPSGHLPWTSGPVVTFSRVWLPASQGGLFSQLLSSGDPCKQIELLALDPGNT